ncbi:MAG: segregation/condensation protein A [Peptostreptococcaceae bacterium]
MKYEIQLNIYEGPLDLLYDLIHKQKIDIKDIAIKEITIQYMEYLNLLEEMNLEITSDFLIMATKLLEIKSKYLLFKQRDNEDEVDPRLELTQKLEEYKKYKDALNNLEVNYQSEVFFRKKEEIVEEDTLDLNTISIKEIQKIFNRLFIKEEVLEFDMEYIVREKIISIEEKIDYIKYIMKDKDEVDFLYLVKNNDKKEVIATFLSVLELIKSNYLTFYQNNTFDNIIIKKLEEN